MMTRIEALRREHNMTQEELGKALNVQKSVISKYEHSKVIPSVEILMKLSNLFNVSVDYLLGNDIQNSHFSSNESDLVHVYRLLPLNKKNLVWEMVRALNASESRPVSLSVSNARPAQT